MTSTLGLTFHFRYFVIGTVPATPWAFYTRNAKGEIMKDAEGRPILEGVYLGDNLKVVQHTCLYITADDLFKWWLACLKTLPQ